MQPFFKVIAVNPQVGSGYFSCPVMVYEGDTVSRVVDRIKRKAGTPGVCLCACVLVCMHMGVCVLVCVHMHACMKGDIITLMCMHACMKGDIITLMFVLLH